MITHLNTVPVYVTDQDRALTFYRDALGFEVTMDASMDSGFRWLTVAPKNAQTQLNLIKVSADMADKVGQWTGMVFYTENIKRTYEELQAKGVVFTEAPRRLDWGGVEGQFADPDGNKFELVERPNF